LNATLTLEGNVTNPFEDENGTYHVLVNDEGQHSLWPSFIEVPDGWTIVLKADTRSACLQYIDQNWTDMRPKSLIAAMEGSSERGQPKENQIEGVTETGQQDHSTRNTETFH
jgi:MbtH protein